MDRTSHTMKTGTNRPYQLVPPETTFTGEMEVLIEDDFLGWKFGKPRDLKESTKGDEWLRIDSRKPEEISQEFLVSRLKAVKRLGGYHSKGFGTVRIEVVEQREPAEKSPTSAH